MSEKLAMPQNGRDKTGRNTQSNKSRQKSTKRDFPRQLPVGGFTFKTAGESALAMASLKPHFAKHAILRLPEKINLSRGRESNPNIFFSNFSGASRISRQNPGISRQKSLIPWVSRDIPNFLAPTPSRGRPPPHQKICGLKSLGLRSFFVPEKSLEENWKKGKDPHPQDKSQHLDFTKEPPAALLQDPSLCILPQKCP